MICPICGSFISAGDAYCPECGYQEPKEEDDDLYYPESITSKPKDRKDSPECPKIYESLLNAVESEDYKVALMLARDMKEYECSVDISEDLKKIRRHYLKRYDDLIRQGNRIDAQWIFEEYVDIYPYDTIFLSYIAVKARENGNLDLVNRVYDMMDEI